VRNRYGGAVSGVIRLGTNLPTNKAVSTAYNYVVTNNAWGLIYGYFAD
jgi:hypothetical protein